MDWCIGMGVEIIEFYPGLIFIIVGTVILINVINVKDHCTITVSM